MVTYVCFDGDGIGQMVGRRRLADDNEGVRIISRRIENGNQVFKAWSESHGTNAIECGGDEGAVEIPPDYLDELPGIKEKYEGVVGATVSIGVGMKLSEASRALMYAKVTGKNKICFYTEEMEETLEKLKEPPEDEKIAGEYMSKAAPATPTAPTPASVDHPVATQGDHEEGQSVLNLLAEDRPAPPEATHAAADYEEQLHQHAAAGEQEDADAANGRQQRLEAVKAQVVQSLQTFKTQAPLFEQLKTQAPDAYQAMTNLVQATIGFARELSPQPLAKKEGDEPEEQVQLVHYGKVPGLKAVSTNKMGTGAPSAEYKQGLPAVARAYYYRSGSAPEPIVTQGAKTAYKASLGTQHRLYDLGVDQENLAGPARERFLAGKGFGHSPQDTLLNDIRAKGYYGYHNSASSQPGTVALFYEHPVEEMGKDEMDMAKKAVSPHMGGRHLELPVGAVVDNHVVVRHSDGKKGSVQISGGAIRSQDPSGHPVSSLRPNSR